MATVDGGRLVVDALKREGVEYIFSLSGGHINSIYQACLDSGIGVIDTRHEQAAAHMAEAWGRMTGKPGVCVVTAGPGFTDAMTGVANACQSHSPLLVITGRSRLPDPSDRRVHGHGLSPRHDGATRSGVSRDPGGRDESEDRRERRGEA